MGIFNKVTATCLSFLLPLASVAGQHGFTLPPQPDFSQFEKKKIQAALNFDYSVKFPRKQSQTITAWVNAGARDVGALLSILRDAEYMSSENIYTDASCSAGYEGPLGCEILELRKVFPSLNLKEADAALLTNFLFQKINEPYTADDPSYTLHQNYSFLLADLAMHPTAGRAVADRLIQTINAVNTGSELQSKVWAARTLSEIYRLPPHARRAVKTALEKNIARLSAQLKNIPTHQKRAVRAVAYETSVFAKREGDSFLQSLIRAGSFTPPQRKAYFQRVWPGMTPDNANFAPTPEGYAHNIASHLVFALIYIYLQEGDAAAINNFITKYARLNSAGEFEYYLMFAVYALNALNVLNAGSLSQNLMSDIYYSALIEAVNVNTPGLIAITNTQMGIEVAGDGVAVLLVITVAGATASVGLKGISRQILAALPIKRAALATGAALLLRNDAQTKKTLDVDLTREREDIVRQILGDNK